MVSFYKSDIKAYLYRGVIHVEITSGILIRMKLQFFHQLDMFFSNNKTPVVATLFI